MRIGAGRWKNALLPRAGPEVRPVPGRLRTSLFSVLAARIPGAAVLDLCAGVGGLGLEALSRGAARVVLVDADPAAVRALGRWIAERGVAAEATAVVADARTGGWPPGPYDLVFLDPPFDAWGKDGEGGLPFLERAAVALAPDGRLAVKVPGPCPIPADPRWRVVDRRSQGSVSYALLAPGAPSTSPPKVPPPGPHPAARPGEPPSHPGPTISVK